MFVVNYIYPTKLDVDEELIDDDTIKIIAKRRYNLNQNYYLLTEVYKEIRYSKHSNSWDTFVFNEKKEAAKVAEEILEYEIGREAWCPSPKDVVSNQKPKNFSKEYPYSDDCGWQIKTSKNAIHFK